MLRRFGRRPAAFLVIAVALIVGSLYVEVWLRQTPDPPAVQGSILVLVNRRDAEATVTATFSGITPKTADHKTGLNLTIDYWLPTGASGSVTQSVRLSGDARLRPVTFPQLPAPDPNLPTVIPGDARAFVDQGRYFCTTEPCTDQPPTTDMEQVVIAAPSTKPNPDRPDPPRAGLRWAGRVLITGSSYRPYAVRSRRGVMVRTPWIQSVPYLDAAQMRRLIDVDADGQRWFMPRRTDVRCAFPRFIERDPRYEVRHAIPEPSDLVRMEWDRQTGLGPNFDVVDSSAEQLIEQWLVAVGVFLACGTSCLAAWLQIKLLPASSAVQQIRLIVHPAGKSPPVAPPPPRPTDRPWLKRHGRRHR